MALRKVEGRVARWLDRRGTPTYIFGIRIDGLEASNGALITRDDERAEEAVGQRTETGDRLRRLHGDQRLTG